MDGRQIGPTCARIPDWSLAMWSDVGTVFPKEGTLSVFVSGFSHSQGESRNLGILMKKYSKPTYYLRARK